MIEIIANDRLGRKGECLRPFTPCSNTGGGGLIFQLFLPVRVKCSPLDTVGDLKKLIAAQTGTPASKIQLKKWYVAGTLYADPVLGTKANSVGCV